MIKDKECFYRNGMGQAFVRFQLFRIVLRLTLEQIDTELSGDMGGTPRQADLTIPMWHCKVCLSLDKEDIIKRTCER